MKNNNSILFIIKYVPSIFILLLSIYTTYYLINEHASNLKEEKSKILKKYIESNKEMIQSNIENTVSKYIEKKFKSSEDELKKDLNHKMNLAYNIMTSIHKEYKDEKTKEEITKLIKTTIKTLRFNKGDDYFFIYDLKGTNILHPIDKGREGKNFINAKDGKGTFIVQESIKIAKSKEKKGFQKWFFKKPNEILGEYEKLGFIKLFEPYNWFIGTGTYIKDFENRVKKDLLEHLNNIRYKNDRNIFVLDYQGHILVSKNKRLDGVDIFKTKKLEAINVGFKDFINSKKKSKIIEYKIKNVNKIDLHKISYIKKIELLNWVIGTGFNFDEVNSRLIKEQKNLEKEHQKNLNTLFLFSILSTCLLLILSYLVSKYIKRIFLNYEEALIKKEKLKFESMMKELKEIFDNLPMMVIYKDTNNNIISVNKNTADSLGKSIQELTNVASEKIFPKDYKKYYIDDLEIINSKKSKIGFVEKYVSKDNIKIIESSKIPVFDENGNVKNIILFINDITEKEKLRIENEKQETLLYQQSKFATMGEMLSSIAHQWKQPLSTISAASSGTRIQKEIGVLSDADLFKALDLINNSTQYLAQTIEDFRNFFRPNKNKFEEIYFSNIVKKTQKLLESKFKSEDIEIIKNIEDIKIISSENGLIQVLINILNNARDELIKKDARKLIFINFYKKDEVFFIEIKDNAGGISDTNINKIFNAYFTTKNDDEGTGIGLYMSKNIVTKLLNGEIYVTNETYIYDDLEYTGAKFIIKL